MIPRQQSLLALCVEGRASTKGAGEEGGDPAAGWDVGLGCEGEDDGEDCWVVGGVLREEVVGLLELGQTFGGGHPGEGGGVGLGLEGDAMEGRA